MRATAHRRGYDRAHQAERARWAAIIRTRGLVECARCGGPITPTTAWDLGHTDDRTAWTGPEHATCNRSAAGRRSHELGAATTIRGWR